MNKITISDSTGKVLYSVESSTAVSTSVASDLADLEEAGKKCAESYKEVVALDTAFGVCSTEGFGDAAAAMAKKMGEKLKVAFTKIAEFFKKIARFINEKLIKAIQIILEKALHLPPASVNYTTITDEAAEKYGLAAVIFGDEGAYNKFCKVFCNNYWINGTLELTDEQIAANPRVVSDVDDPHDSEMLDSIKTMAKNIDNNKSRLSTMAMNRKKVLSKLGGIQKWLETLKAFSDKAGATSTALIAQIRLAENSADTDKANMDNMKRRSEILMKLYHKDMSAVGFTSEVVRQMLELLNSNYKVLISKQPEKK